MTIHSVKVLVLMHEFWSNLLESEEIQPIEPVIVRLISFLCRFLNVSDRNNGLAMRNLRIHPSKLVELQL